MFDTELDRFKTIGLIEGVSFLTLLFIAMPLKYIWMLPIATKIVGIMHGALFTLYLYMQFQASRKLNWRVKENLFYFIASLIPFGTFWSDRKLARIKEGLN